MDRKIIDKEEIILSHERRITQVHIARSLVIFLLTCVVMLAAMLTRLILIDRIGQELGNFAVLTYICISIGFLLLVFGYLLYCYYIRKPIIIKSKTLACICTSMTVTFVACLYVDLISIFAMPVFLTSYLVSPLASKKDALAANTFTLLYLLYFLLIKGHFAEVSTLEVITMMVIGIACGSVVAYGLFNDFSRVNFVVRGIVVAIFAVALMIIMTFIGNKNPISFLDQLPYIGCSALAQIILSLILQPVFERMFNVITNIRLVELTDHRSPLMHRLITEAPGTYNHSLAVANFAGMCAEAIGENTYLARACAMYHDVGKLTNALFFKENQSNYNPHDDLLPEVSAEIIRSHTTEGYDLCKLYNIPQEIRDVTVQHHGTLPIYIFYNKATKMTDGSVDIDDYSYHGHIPMTKIAAIIMISDSSEAAIRAMDAPDGDKVDKLLRKLIGDRIASGQFDDCDITMNELNIVRETIISAYGGLFHKRLKYPEGK